MATQIQILNISLGHLAQRNITTFPDTNSVQATAANAVWTICLEETLRSNDWAFARAFKALVVTTTIFDPEPYGYAYAYVMPTNCVALRSVFNSNTQDKRLGEIYERVHDPVSGEQLILTNCIDAYARYTYLITTTTLFDSSFVTALGYRLAAELCLPLLGDMDKANNLIKLFTNSISESQRIDSYEDNPKGNTTNHFVDARS